MIYSFFFTNYSSYVPLQNFIPNVEIMSKVYKVKFIIECVDYANKIYSAYIRESNDFFSRVKRENELTIIPFDKKIKNTVKPILLGLVLTKEKMEYTELERKLSEISIDEEVLEEIHDYFFFF